MLVAEGLIGVEGVAGAVMYLRLEPNVTANSKSDIPNLDFRR